MRGVAPRQLRFEERHVQSTRAPDTARAAKRGFERGVGTRSAARAARTSARHCIYAAARAEGKAGARCGACAHECGRRASRGGVDDAVNARRLGRSAALGVEQRPRHSGGASKLYVRDEAGRRKRGRARRRARRGARGR